MITWTLGVAATHAADNVIFERVLADKYADMLRDGGFAYDHKDYAHAFE